MKKNSLDINTFISLKTNSSVLALDNNVLTNLKELFGDFDKTKKHHKNETSIHILKNQKLQNKKETMTNKVNLILNKLSESNMNNLLGEFLENINQISLEEYNEIQKTFYMKIISESIFMNIYLKFFKLVTYIYNIVQKYDISYFISLVESKFYHDYQNKECADFIKSLNSENNRMTNLELIINMVNNKLLSENIFNDCDNIILTSTNNLIDIYHWFNFRNKILSTDEKNKIKLIMNNLSKLSREYILLTSILDKKENDKPVVTLKKETVVKNTLYLECENIIDEYIFIKSLDDIKYFIDNRCVDAINKNIFSEVLIDKYLSSNKENVKEIVGLFKTLVDSQILFKSNLSRGLILIYNNWKERMIDYNNPNEKMISLLNLLKKMNITKNIEKIFNDFNITC